MKKCTREKRSQFDFISCASLLRAVDTRIRINPFFRPIVFPYTLYYHISPWTFFILRPTKKTRKQLQMGIFFSFRIRGFDFGFDSRGKHAISLVRKKTSIAFVRLRSILQNKGK